MNIIYKWPKWLIRLIQITIDSDEITILTYGFIVKSP